jgi:hypothetical protein
MADERYAIDPGDARDLERVTEGHKGKAPKVMDFMKTRKLLSPALRGRLKETAGEDRSAQTYKFASMLIETDPTKTLFVSALHHYPPAKDKWGGGKRMMDEALRLWGKMHENGAGPPDPEERKDRIVGIQASSQKPSKPEWLWKKWIPLRHLTMLAGRQGNGKSQVAIWIAAQLSQGKLTPEPQSTVIASFEDSVEETILARVHAAAPNKDLIRILTNIKCADGSYRPLRLPYDMDLLAEYIAGVNAKLLVLDPLNDALDVENSNLESDVRRGLEPLNLLARELNIGILAIGHVRKAKSEHDVLARVLGSTAYTAVPRSVMFLGYPKEGDDLRLAHLKSNLGKLQISRKVRIKEIRRLDTSRAFVFDEAWEDAHELNVAPPDEGKKLQAAMDFLLEELAIGAQESRALLDKGEALGFSNRTLRRAKAKLGSKVKVDNARGPGTRAIWST